MNVRARDHGDRLEKAALAWSLLLPLDVSDYGENRPAEGTVDFLIRERNLFPRDFAKTIVVFQQT